MRRCIKAAKRITISARAKWSTGTGTNFQWWAGPSLLAWHMPRTNRIFVWIQKLSRCCRNSCAPSDGRAWTTEKILLLPACKRTVSSEKSLAETCERWSDYIALAVFRENALHCRHAAQLRPAVVPALRRSAGRSSVRLHPRRNDFIALVDPRLHDPCASPP